MALAYNMGPQYIETYSHPYLTLSEYHIKSYRRRKRMYFPNYNEDLVAYFDTFFYRHPHFEFVALLIPLTEYHWKMESRHHLGAIQPQHFKVGLEIDSGDC